MALFDLARRSMPLTDQGKWRTGITKKLFESSIIPANTLYHATKDVRSPKNPPALMMGGFGKPSLLRCRYPMASRSKVKSTVKNRKKNAKVDRRVSRRRSVVNMNQPIKKKPNESKNIPGPPAASMVSGIANPPGVRVIAKAIQKPPYEDSAVAPKVFPIAISHMPAKSCTKPP